MNLLESLRGGLVVSCQPVDGGAMDAPFIVAAMAKASEDSGAFGVRIEGIENLRAARPKISIPIIGIIKEDLPNSPVRITPRIDQVNELAEAGADIIAYDATDRPRVDHRDKVLGAIVNSGKIAMADCSTFEDAQIAIDKGAKIIGTTLSGYTEATASNSELPDFELITQFAGLGVFAMAEGRISTPEQVTLAFKCGADSVTVGTALTRLEPQVEMFVNRTKARSG